MNRIVVMSTGAWDRWRDEVRAKARTADAPMDALYHAAWYDSMGLDALDDYRATQSESALYMAEMFFAESEGFLRREAARIAAEEKAA
jgi:hypothetical protein